MEIVSKVLMVVVVVDVEVVEVEVVLEEVVEVEVVVLVSGGVVVQPETKNSSMTIARYLFIAIYYWIAGG